jgi:hypothetical protein
MLDLESVSTTRESTTTTAPTKKRRVARRTEREARLEVALAARDAMRARGESPPLPSPEGRTRSERTLRYVAYEDARRRREAGTATPEELAYLESRFAHLSAWRKAKNARRQQRPGLQDPSTKPKKKKKRASRAKRKVAPVYVTAPVREPREAAPNVDDISRPDVDVDRVLDRAIDDNAPAAAAAVRDDADPPPPRLRGPDDLRAFMEGRRSSQ